MHIDKIETRFDRPRPTFEEDGVHIYNRYWPPAHPTSGGEIETFEAFFARLIPNDVERDWMWNYLAHKARRPWVPMIAVIMVAEEFGTGRGTLFDILELLFGEDYVVPCTFGELTGTAAGARFNDRLANALIATVMGLPQVRTLKRRSFGGSLTTSRCWVAMITDIAICCA